MKSNSICTKRHSLLAKKSLPCYHVGMRANPYIGNLLTPVIEVNTVYTIHYFRYGWKFDIAGEAHDFWEIVYLDAGEATVRAGERTLLLRQGEAIFHKPNEFHNIRTKDKFTCSVILSFACDSPAMSFFENKVLVPDEEERRLLRSIVSAGAEVFSDKLNLVELKKMTKREPAPLGGEQWIKNSLELFLLSLLRRSAGREKTSPPLRATAGGERLAEDVYAILKKNLRRNLSLAEISRALNFSETHVKNVFKRQTGRTVMDAFRLLKVEEAKQLISTRKFTFTQIAYMLGFSSAGHFSRVFKQYADLSPGEYARTVGVENVL